MIVRCGSRLASWPIIVVTWANFRTGVRTRSYRPRAPSGILFPRRDSTALIVTISSQPRH